MSVFKYAVAAAVGYYVGQPNSRRQVQRLREQAVELVRGPRAKQLKERGWDIAVKRTSAAIKRAQRRRADGSAAALDLSDTASRPFGDAAASELSGFGGRTVAEIRRLSDWGSPHLLRWGASTTTSTPYRTELSSI